MERQNVTLSLPRLLLKQAKTLAAKEDKSLSAFLKESLEEKIRKTTGYKEAKERQIRLMRKGFDFGIKGRLTISREEIHERR
ncbi:MAG: CopG family transcriptional regulator [Nitrospirae bacterium CG_4_10_14_0_8_um_filter_41_23]|nr:MAG: CopG family transcriptional regulator [Nitrospirae bacterium CG11_big_fil_rev_8_21_14_0_20_41_14]PIV41915.1 MAG: CopG family transcriptional regulator [Nitrospirae bacterium CG02_land_8_20_14_3_00_41_53]PIW86646.1 MAG: CopG family transcriptional regulator [Nitrospirae bacterium CG_4_8_14_3_um_filter_41_47]PIY86079.1 MAG: CopG family transcriptional regulator [Nitrospirae bacterium CG_4_10_14_0_8_um_filter_41_23]PJA80917.1 MAG: CopG family transcriptional regulator [Nitrospirae bacteriu